MSTDRDHITADRDTIEAAARALRDTAISDSYAGLSQPARAFALALMLDELARHVRDLDHELRVTVVRACRILLGETA